MLRHENLIRGLYACLLALAFPAAVSAQPELLVLGSAHLANPGRDATNMQVSDVLTPRRQQEIASLVERLADFAPTHIAVEIPARYQQALDERYRNYRNGDYELSRNEADQIGLRLAARLGLGRVHAVDWNDNPPGDIEADYDWYSYGREHGLQGLIDAITSPERAAGFMPELRDQDITTWYRQLNDPEALAASHRVYFDIARVGSGDELIGANWVGTWYARNLKIFSRLSALADSPDARVLVIYGQGHAYLLRQFARETGKFGVIDVESVLGDD